MSIGSLGVRALDHVALTVPDMEAAVRFYVDVLGAEEHHAVGPFDAREMPRAADGRDWTDAHMNVADARVSFRVLSLGGLILELFHYERPDDAQSVPPRNCDVGGHHFGLRVDDLDAATALLRERGVRVLDGPIETPADAPGGPMRVRFFLDPWGNQLELTEYDGAGVGA